MAMKVKVEIRDQSPTANHHFVLDIKVTLYLPLNVIEEYGLGPELDADAASTPAAAITFVKNHAITFAATRGLTAIASEVFVFGGPQ